MSFAMSSLPVRAYSKEVSEIMNILRKCDFWHAGIESVRYPIPFCWLTASALMVYFKEISTGIHENGLGVLFITKKALA